MLLRMYNKLFTKILDSSIWLENQPTRIVWITFIACMDQDGVVALSSVGNVANRARVSLEEAEAAIHCLESPDIYNPDQEQEGRRIERIPGVGWVVLNAQKYRDIIKAETARMQTRERTKAWRERHKNGDGDADVTVCDENVTPSEAETEAKAHTEQIQEVFSFWKETMNHSKTTLSQKRKTAIKSRLKEGFTVEEIKQAVRGCKLSPHHQGQNESGAIYDDIELICRTDDKLRRFMRYAEPKATSEAQAIAKQVDDINLDIDKQLYGR